MKSNSIIVSLFHNSLMSPSCWRLAWRLAVVEFSLRNEGSYLGNVWYVIHPLLLFSVFYFIFVERVGSTIENYPAYLIIGILFFNFFSRVSLEMTSVIKDSGFIKSFNFPRESLVLAVVLKHALAHIFEAMVFFLLLSFLGVSFFGIFLYLGILLLLVFFMYGLGLFLSAVTMYIVDLANAWQFLTLLLLFITPIFHSITTDSVVAEINVFNPLFYFITAARDVVIYQRVPELSIISGVFLLPVVSICVGQYIFSKYKPAFAELI